MVGYEVAGARADVSLNLSLAAASSQSRVLLVDADLKQRDISHRVVGGKQQHRERNQTGEHELDDVEPAEPGRGVQKRLDVEVGTDALAAVGM